MWYLAFLKSATPMFLHVRNLPLLYPIKIAIIVLTMLSMYSISVRTVRTLGHTSGPERHLQPPAGDGARRAVPALLPH